MSLTLVSNPTYDAGVSPVSAVAAGLSQLPYVFERKDFAVTRITSIADQPLIEIPTVNVAAQFPAGTKVYVFSDVDFPSGDYTVASADFSGGNTRVFLDFFWNQGQQLTTGSHINILSGARADYKVVIEIRDEAGTANLFPISFRYQTTNAGRLFIDIALVLRDFILDPQVPFIQYLIRYQEFYTGALVPSAVNDVPIMAIASVKQQLDIGGSNLWESLLNPAGTYLGWNRFALNRGGTGFALPTIGLNNTGSGTFPWAFTSNEIRVNNLQTHNTTNPFYFDVANFVDGAIPRGSQLVVQYRVVFFVNTFTSGNQYRINLKVVPDGENESTFAASTIAFHNINITRRNPAGTNYSGTIRANSSVSARGALIEVSGTAGPTVASHVVFTNISIQSNLSGRVFMTRFRNPSIQALISQSAFTRQNNPPFWVGWVRKARWIVDPDYAARTGFTGVIVFENDLDVNMQGIGVTRQIVYGLVIGVNEYTLNPTIDNPLVKNFQFRLVAEGGSGNAISETMIFRMVTPEEQCDRPLMIEWENSRGGLDQWLFGVQQTVNNSSEEGIIFDRPIVEDFETAHSSVGRIVDKKLQSVVVTAENLTRQQLQALMEIKQSNYVSVWLDQTGTNYVQVKVVLALETNYSNKSRAGHSITITLTMPDNFNLYDSGIYDLLLE